MSLENFKVPKTPESRTPYVLALLAIIGAGKLAWDTLIHSRYSVEIIVALAVGAIAYVVWRNVRKPASSR